MRKNKLILDSKFIIETLGNEYTGLANIVSDKFGIINAMLKRYELSRYNLNMYQCLSANARDIFDLDREVSSGGLGVSENEQAAMISCLAEAIERYCISYIPQKEVVYKKKNELDRNRVFEEFHVYSDEQYKKHKEFANPNKEAIHWTKIKSICGRDWKYWPASLIYLPFNVSKPVAETTTTGTAAGTTIKECIKSGVLELLERDALMINFLQQLNPPEIDIDSIKGKNRKFIKLISEEYNVKIYNLYTDINVPIYFSIIWKKRRGKIHYGIGASASLDSDIAINKALKECLFTFFYSENILDLKKNNPNDIRALYEHFLYYQEDNFDKILFDSKVKKYVRKKVEFDDIVVALKEKSINIYYKELTTDDVKGTNIKVVKVIAPGLIDLNKSHVLPRLGAKRFWEMPNRLGIKVGNELSSKPHPFP